MSPRCPRCDGLVYAAEQILGPGRKFYHKPCLTCTICRRRLDSYTLLEHDEQPYCKPCHLKNFGPRHTNLPYAPLETTDLPILRPTRVLSPTSPNFPRPISRPGSSSGHGPVLSPTRRTTVIREESPTDAEADTSLESSMTDSTDPTSADEADELEIASKTSLPTNTGRPGLGNMPRTVPLSFDLSSHVSRHKLGSISTSPSSPPFTPTNSATPAAAALTLLQQEGLSPVRHTPTGTRYGTALGAQITGSARKWGGSTPQCPKCSKSVYFAEQVKAIGKTYHKYCLRCTECNTSLDSTKLRDHDEEPFCVRCYNKLHGPQGQGYALLGKPGG